MQSILRKSTAYLVIFAMVMTTAFSLTVDNGQAATKPTKINLTKAATYVDIGAKLKISVKSVSPSKASKSVNWTITKGSKYGKLVNKTKTSVYLSGVKAGTVTIKATSRLTKKVTKTITVTVKNLKAKAIKLDKTSKKVETGQGFTLKATVTPPQKTGYKPQVTTWKTSNKDVATVSKGVVKTVGNGTAKITATNDGKSATCSVLVAEGTVLRPFVLVGWHSPTKLNGVDIDKSASVLVWSETKRDFIDGKNNQATIVGNYVQLEDLDADKKADLIKVVKKADGSNFWDADKRWILGLGSDIEPEISDEAAEELYGSEVEYRIPFGERLLGGFGIGDYCGVNDYYNQADSPYWPTYDYYNLKSGNNLTILEGYRTTPQVNGSNCVMSSALTVLDWYGVRGDLNENDLGALRGEGRRWGGGTSLDELETTFKRLDELDLAGKANWVTESWNDENCEYNLYDPAWIKDHLAAGHPIMVIWNSYGAHGQVIIGYDDRGTENTADDQLIMMDPYDTTDHDNDGYTIQSYERLAYGTLSWGGEVTGTKFMVAYPEGWEWSPSTAGEGLPNVATNKIVSDDANKLNALHEPDLLDRTIIDIENYYRKDKAKQGEGDYEIATSHLGLGGAWAYERNFDYDFSPYYSFYDYFGGTKLPTGTLTMLENFRTVQQATEWTCGTASALMNIEWFGKNGNVDTGDALVSELDLGLARQNGDRGATYLKGMEQMFRYMNKQNKQDWVWFTINDLEYDENWEVNFIGGHGLEWGSDDSGLIPYLIDKGIPMMIGWDEWGGHWQVIVGYDDMGTPETQDDVLILADPYDTTDHDNDGYYVESFERLVYGWNSNFEKDVDGPDYDDFIVAFPRGGNQDVVDELGL